VLGGREVLDAPLDLPQSADDAVATFSDRATELHGTLTDRTGRPAPEHFVVVFSIDPRSWFFHSRRVAGIQADAQGGYAVRNLPPGDYFVAAVDDLDPDECYDPVLLQGLVNGASRITLTAGEKKTHDVAVTRTRAAARHRLQSADDDLAHVAPPVRGGDVGLRDGWRR
jgi:hypothetical protein